MEFKKYVNIIIDISSEKLDKTFQYRIPDELRGKLKPGMRLHVPFGRGKRTGYIVDFSDEPEIEEERIKEVYGIVEGAVPVEERLISVDELFGAAKDGSLEEAWCVGTAAVVSPIGELARGDEKYTINDFKIGETSQKLYDELTGIQWGSKPDPFGWTMLVTKK